VFGERWSADAFRWRIWELVRNPRDMARLALPTLTTRDCKLRPWTLEDASALREACGDADICRFTTVPVVYSEDAAVQWIERQRVRAAAGTGIVLAIVPTGDPQPVGMIGLFGMNRPEPIARFGYWLIARARGRGLATDAARALSRWAFACLEVEALLIDCEPSNLASARVAAHLGATLSGSRWVRIGDDEVELDRYRLERIPDDSPFDD
jgi:[ribosomal protein S5]-alanine N-acetyltransferase